ncbi:DIEXF [Branchiostoma lanceolatum]|uniref:U3 small nucleolar RNA-associated protein 25 homolog n=1 Tax=Branchiostoma lanceolatum TaxID=7740 RepID=A0A8J9ZRB6_BRALA|nr:DIEXF [Branchiostoma lanceolatum]
MARGRGRGGRRREDRQKAKQRQINRALKLSEINSKARYQQEEYLRRRQQAEREALRKAQGEGSQQPRPDKNDEASSSSSESEDERQTPYDLLVTSLQSNRDQSSSEEISESENDDDDDDDVQEEEDDIESDEDSEQEDITREHDGEDVSTDNEEEETVPEDIPSDEERTVKGKKRKKDDVGKDGALEQKKKKLKSKREEQEKEGQWSSDGESEVEDLEEEKTTTGKDPFWQQVTTELQEDQVDKLGQQSNWAKKEATWKVLGRLQHTYCPDVPNKSIAVNKDSITKMNVRGLLCTNWVDVNGAGSQKNAEEIKTSSDGEFTARQRELFSLIHGYKDLYYSERTHQNGEELRKLYCLHALNHVLKTRSVLTRHNSKLKLGAEVNPDSDEFQDQGLTRPKVLLVVPFREAALRTVQVIIQLMRRPDGKQVEVMNKKRFQDEYSELEHAPPKVPLPEDFEATFAGNIDDHFRIGLSVSRRNIRLYSPFYLSDIIIASPLGLRTVIGAEGEKDRDYDFLSSIEVLILDQADTYLMQNWEHIQHLMQHMHLQPKETHETDFSRVRMWYLNGWAKFYRQTLIFSSIPSPEINAIFNKQCHNYSGKVQVSNPPARGTICQVALQLPQVFQRVECSSFTQAADARFNFFVSQILPQMKDGNMQRTLFFIPSYFDFVRIRNYFRQEDITFAQICEYTTQANISRARQYFQRGDRPFLLFTERFHFFRRYRIKGIRSLVFYELPLFPHFYSELCNMLETGGEEGVSDRTCTVMYTKYDAQRLAAVVGASRCGHMITSSKSVHMFVTGEQG